MAWFEKYRMRIIALLERDEILSAAYASDLVGRACQNDNRFVATSGARLWIHGHIHHQQDYWLDTTRVICNPRGYPDEPNDRFIPDLTIEI